MLNALTSIGKKLLSTISKNSTVILTTITVTGVVTTLVFGVKATPKAMNLIDDELYSRYEKEDPNLTYQEWLGVKNCSAGWSERIRLLTPLELVGTVWKCYIPTAIMAAITMGSAIGAHSIHVRQNAALASLYSLTETAFKEYQTKIVDTIGKNKELKVRDELAVDAMNKHPLGSSEVILTGKGESLFYDALSGRYFKSDIERIKRAMHQVNNDIVNEKFITLNDFYAALGLEHVVLGEDTGWNLGYGAFDIQFTARMTPEEEVCIAMNYDVQPRYY